MTGQPVDPVVLVFAAVHQVERGTEAGLSPGVGVYAHGRTLLPKGWIMDYPDREVDPLVFEDPGWPEEYPDWDCPPQEWQEPPVTGSGVVRTSPAEPYPPLPRWLRGSDEYDAVVFWPNRKYL